ncbi:hypothetical protein QJS10_CPB18g01649 [Acorus calamus]|uniref:Kinesin light chain n=1 Tax=Acorus calamus TaxID=4465 RepID=A0AAV9CLK3_ACOCL|nr:hypothetical protein QJS10_CPB18g01649 [Acorus calamus]
MESAFGEDDKRLALACLNVGQHLDSVGSSDHDEILSFASRALKILDRGGDSDVTIVKALILMGSVMFNLKRFDECFGYLNRADRILDVICEAVPGDLDIRSLRHTVQHKLAKMKTGVGRRAEAVEHLRKCLELKESILEMGDVRLAVMNRELAEALSGVLNFKEALLSCLKALEIHESGLGHGSVEVGRDRRLLSTIYCALGEHRRALEQIVLCQKVFDDLGLVADLNDAGIIEANIQIASGKFEEAMNTLGGVVKKMDKESLPRAMVFIAMAKALCKMERLSDAKRCSEIACDILEAKELVVPARVAEAYAEAALLYEAMNDFEAELSILKRGVAILEGLPQEWQLQGTLEGRVGFVFLHMGKVPQAVPYLESALEKLKESFGPKQLAVGYAYKNLGVAYLELDRAQSAVQMLLAAKENITASVGPLHVETIDTCQNLANAYNAMGSPKNESLMLGKATGLMLKMRSGKPNEFSIR